MVTVIEQRYLRRLADLDHQIARLMVERSEVLREMAAVAQPNVEPAVPVIPFAAPTQLDRARAARALQRNADRRRSTR